LASTPVERLHSARLPAHRRCSPGWSIRPPPRRSRWPPHCLSPQPRQFGLHHRDAIAILFARAGQFGHRAFDRIEPSNQRPDARLSRRRIVDQPGGVRRLTLGKDLLLHLANLLFEPVDALFGGRRTALGARGSQRETGENGK